MTRCAVCRHYGDRPGKECDFCGVPLDPPASAIRSFIDDVRSSLTVRVLAGSSIRFGIGVVGLYVGEPIAREMAVILGKIAHAASLIFVMLALWGVLLPIEHAIMQRILDAFGVPPDKKDS